MTVFKEHYEKQEHREIRKLSIDIDHAQDILDLTTLEAESLPLRANVA